MRQSLRFVLVAAACAVPLVVALDQSEPASAVAPDFVVTFDGNTGLERFDYGLWHRDDNLVRTQNWTGDHDANCGSPDTQRPIRRDRWRESFYMCRDHMMTAVGDTSGYSLAWFTPKQSFTDQTMVSWDVNVTDLGGRQWWEVMIYPESDASRYFEARTESQHGTDCLVCTTEGWMAQTAGLLPYGPGSIVVGTGPAALQDPKIHYDGRSNLYTANTKICKGAYTWFKGSGACDSKKTRLTFSIRDNQNGTITVDFGGAFRQTFSGSFPDEPWRVVFKDHNYTPDKDGPPIGHTWHWDNIAVTSDPPPPDTAPTGAASSFNEMKPFRFADSRTGHNLSRLQAGAHTRVRVAGRYGIPTDATAISANFTAVGPNGRGFFTAGHCAAGAPAFSTLNFGDGEVSPNQAIVPLDNGDLCLYSHRDADLVIDVNGYLSPSSGLQFQATTPRRLLDTRNTTALRKGQIVRLDVEGGSSPAPTAARAVALNITAADPLGDGWVRAFPCGSESEVSSLNPRRGINRPNSAIVPTSSGGEICLRSNITTDIVIDITGWFEPSGGLRLQALEPIRLVDLRSRNRHMNPFADRRLLQVGKTLRVPIAGIRGIPASAKAASLNVTTLSSLERGWIRVVPCGSSPLVSTGNFSGPMPVANGVNVQLGPGGDVCITSNRAVHVLVDISAIWS
jgi:hypothetical protein